MYLLAQEHPAAQGASSMGEHRYVSTQFMNRTEYNRRQHGPGGGGEGDEEGGGEGDRGAGGRGEGGAGGGGGGGGPSATITRMTANQAAVRRRLNDKLMFFSGDVGD